MFATINHRPSRQNGRKTTPKQFTNQHDSPTIAIAVLCYLDLLVEFNAGGTQFVERLTGEFAKRLCVRRF